MSFDRVLKAALALPPHEQRGLVGHLYRNLQDAGEDIMSAEWLAEIQRRSDEIDQGKTKLMSYVELKRRVEKLRKSVGTKK